MCQWLGCQAPLHQHKSPYSRLSADGSGLKWSLSAQHKIFVNITFLALSERKFQESLVVANQQLWFCVKAVVPNRGGIPPWGGISWVQGRNFHFIVKLPNHCVLIKFTLTLSMSSITLYLSVIQWNSTRICWQALVLLFGNKFFSSHFY